LHSGAGAFADQAAFQFSEDANHLPHGAALSASRCRLPL
jgi:hypothetical protein